MATSGFRVVYDSSTDVLYVPSTDGAAPPGPEAGQARLRFSIGGDDLIGTTLARFNARWRDRFAAVASGPRPGPAPGDAP